MSNAFAHLVTSCLNGDQNAITELVNRYRGQVFGLCFRILGHRQDAEDATQETFLRVLDNLNRWDRHRAFEPWLFAIASNRCRTALGKRKRRPPMKRLVEAASTTDTSQPDGRALSEEVTLAVRNLRTEYRLAFSLFHDRGMTYLEISQILGCPIGTAKTWVHRARRKLVQQLLTREVLTETPHHAM